MGQVISSAVTYAAGAGLNLTTNSSFGTTGLFISGGITTAGTGSITVGGASDTRIDGVIGSGVGGIIKNGEGVLLLFGTNTFTGTTAASAVTINAGVVYVTADAVGLGNAANGVTFPAGSTGALRFSSGVSTARTLTLIGDGIIDGNTAPAVSVNLTGAGKLTKTGQNILLLLGGTAGNFTRILFATAPTLTDGVIANATFDGFGGTGQATYDAARGVILFSAIPEPTTVFLMAFGGLGLGAGVRRRWFGKKV